MESSNEKQILAIMAEYILAYVRFCSSKLQNQCVTEDTMAVVVPTKSAFTSKR